MEWRMNDGSIPQKASRPYDHIFLLNVTSKQLLQLLMENTAQMRVDIQKNEVYMVMYENLGQTIKG